MRANDTQVGGTHYRREGRQHWDLMAEVRAEYLPAQITRYVERHEQKNGQEDAQKALHYAHKWHEVAEGRRARGDAVVPASEATELAVCRYTVEAGLRPDQAAIFVLALTRPDRTGLLVRLTEEWLRRTYPSPTSAVLDVYDALARGWEVPRDEAKRRMLAYSGMRSPAGAGETAGSSPSAADPNPPAAASDDAAVRPVSGPDAVAVWTPTVGDVVGVRSRTGIRWTIAEDHGDSTYTLHSVPSNDQEAIAEIRAPISDMWRLV